MIVYYLFRSDNVEIVELLIKNGLDVSTIDFTGMLTKEQLAQLSEKEDMFKLLKINGANLRDAENEKGFKLLQIEAQRGRILLAIQFLISIFEWTGINLILCDCPNKSESRI